MSWQPIETAPKDGTCVLLWVEEARIVGIGGFVREGVWADPSGGVYFTATDWMTLPPPPVKARRRE